MILLKEPKSKRGQASLQSLITGAEKMFYKKGFYKTCIRDITDCAGVGLGTFYIYFKNKKAIYDYLLIHYSHVVRSRIASEIQKQNPKTRYDEEKIGLRTFIQIVTENHGLYKIIWEALYVDEQVFKNYYSSFAENYMHRIKDGQNREQVKKHDPEVVAYVLMGISSFIGLNWSIFKKSEPQELDRVCDQVLGILDKGLFLP